MFKAVTKTLCMAAITSLAACTVPISTPAQHQSQPHLPPPDFSASDTSEKTRLCGVRQVGGGADVCETGEFCRRTIGDLCGAADAPGICTPVPEICTQQYGPVCGCDGQTYGNECEANGKGVSASYTGECKS